MTAPVGVVLAGGAGRRMGGAKPTALLARRPLLSYPLAALAAVLADVAVVAKAGTELPQLPGGVSVWHDPDEPQHPLAGIVEALRRADGRAVVVVACDLPLVDSALVRALATADTAGAPAVVTRAGGRPQPLCARYDPAALDALAGYDPGGRTVEQIEALGPLMLDVEPRRLRNVNRPEDLAAVESELRAGS